MIRGLTTYNLLPTVKYLNWVSCDFKRKLFTRTSFGRYHLPDGLCILITVIAIIAVHNIMT